MTWDAVAAGCDVVYGDLDLLRSSTGNFSTAVVGCPDEDLSTTTLTVADSAGPTNAFFLLRPAGCGGANGSYDLLGLGQVSQRDAAIDASVLSCL